jgi:glycerophosphoryl diester phosphodiesterase
MAVGAHEIEFDLWASRDGVPVACHDATVDRTTDGTGRISDLTWREVRGLDAGIRCSAAWRGVRVPRLEEVLAFAGGQIVLNVHLKDTGPGNATLRQVCDLLIEGELAGSAYLALGTEPALEAAIEYAPEIPRACLANQGDPDASIDTAARTACQRIQFGRHVTAEQIRRARDLDLICNLFWSDDPQEGMAYARQGIDVILTNCAHTMIAGGFAALEHIHQRAKGAFL